MTRRLILGLMQTRFYRYLLMKIIPFVRFSTYYTSLRGNKYHALYDHLCPGDVILTVDKKKLTTLLVPGTWTHAALCVNKRPSGFEIVEMTHENFTRSDFFDVCKEADRVSIFRTPMVNTERNRVIETAMTFKNSTYDVEFDLGVKALYCSELVYQAFVKSGIDLGVSLEDIHGLGRQYISPDGLSKAKNLMRIIDSEYL